MYGIPGKLFVFSILEQLSYKSDKTLIIPKIALVVPKPAKFSLKVQTFF